MRIKMKIYRHLIKKFKNQRGAVAIIVAIMLFFVLIGIMALAIDVGYFYSTKNELQNIADAAALAGAGKLGNIYTSMTPAEQDTHDFEADRPAIIASAREVVRDDESEISKNPAGGKDIIEILDTDIQIGNWDPSADPKFNPINSPIPIGTLPDAVKVTVRRDASANDPISTFFGIIFGKKNQVVTADAVAALTTLAQLPPGKMNLPIGLSEKWFETNTCGSMIEFSPTTDSCAGWHNFFDAINTSAMRNKFKGFINNDPLEEGNCLSSPCGEAWLDTKFGEADYPVVEPTDTVIAGDSEFEFQGGTISALFTGQRLKWDAPAGLGTNDYITPKDADGDGKQDIDGSGQIAAFPALFDYFRFRDGDGVKLADGSVAIYKDDNGVGYGIDLNGDGTDDITHPDSVWTSTVPVYRDLAWEETGSCMNPNDRLEILGFARVTVIMPNPPPDSTVTAIIDCNLIYTNGIGGGGMSGTVRASIPNLVE